MLRTPPLPGRPDRRRSPPGRPPHGRRGRGRFPAPVTPLRPTDYAVPIPPGNRTSGTSSGSSPSIRARLHHRPNAQDHATYRAGDCCRANSTIRRVGSDDCGPTISSPTSCNWSASRRAMNVDSRDPPSGAILEQQRPQLVPVHGDISHRLCDDRRQIHRLARQEVHLAQKPRRPMANDLVPSPIEDRGLSLENRDQRITCIADPEQHVTDRGVALLAVQGQRRKLRLRQGWATAAG